MYIEFLLKISRLLTKLEFILVPVANPDGYAVSQYLSLSNNCTMYIYMLERW